MSMPQTTEQRIEQRIDALESQVAELRRLIGASSDWVSVRKASELLGISGEVIRRRIREAIIAPRQSPYKKGKHWRGDRPYQINYRQWQEVLNGNKQNF